MDRRVCWETDLFRIGEKLLNRAVKRRVRIRRVIVEATASPLPHEQLSLFHHQTHVLRTSIGRELDEKRGRRVAEALDRIRHKFGATAVKWGRTAE